jgi:hypothetical protein
VKFKVDGTLYDIELESLTLDEGEILEDYAKLTLKEFAPAVMGTRVRALRALVMIAKRRAGEQVEWADLGTVDLMELGLSIIEENDIDIAAADNGENPQAVAQLGEILAQRRKAPKPNRQQRRHA